MLSNAYFLAKFRFDTAENEPAKNLQILQKEIASILLTLTPNRAGDLRDHRAGDVRRHADGAEQVPVAALEHAGVQDRNLL